jgi:hypothetical protein
MTPLYLLFHKIFVEGKMEFSQSVGKPFSAFWSEDFISVHDVFFFCAAKIVQTESNPKQKSIFLIWIAEVQPIFDA